ncbi:MAG TPA: class I SAM-dependent methyltransferase [Stellaceae bacterium]|nr:class I SAM-dependent methyltransferase [Stellaceae bacterium]
MAEPADSLAAERPSPIAGTSLLRVRASAEPDRVSVAAMAARLAPAGEPAAPPDPLTIRQWLWGPGFHTPGTAEDVLRLAEPFGATASTQLLDVAAGLGGAARTIAAQSGAYVSALERDPDLARRGRAMSLAAGRQKQVPVGQMDPETLELRAGTFDGILGREATHLVIDKERFLRVLLLGLRPRGQLLLTEFVVEPALAARPELAAWAALQPREPLPWTLRQYSDCFLGLGVELRVPEDISAAYKSWIVDGWARLLRTVDLRSLPRAHRLAVVAEAERWMPTVAALDSGALRMYRFHMLAGPVRSGMGAGKLSAAALLRR